MDATTLRAWWWHRQGLDGSLAGKTAAEVLDQAGWARSVGGANPYLTLFARAGLRRAAVDAAVAALEIHELPSARGCTHVVPARDFALALMVGQAFGGGDMNVARKLGVTDKDVDNLCEKVLAALGKGPLDPDALRVAAGPAVKTLGEEGKKKGLTSTLPVATGRLQQTGQIRRMPTDGRLDQQRYRYAIWKLDPGAERIAWWAFGANPKDKALVAAVERTEAFVAGDLGDARSFSLDSPKSRAPRIAALRRAAAHA